MGEDVNNIEQKLLDLKNKIAETRAKFMEMRGAGKLEETQQLYELIQKETEDLQAIVKEFIKLTGSKSE